MSLLYRTPHPGSKISATASPFVPKLVSGDPSGLSRADPDVRGPGCHATYTCPSDPGGDHRRFNVRPDGHPPTGPEVAVRRPVRVDPEDVRGPVRDGAHEDTAVGLDRESRVGNRDPRLTPRGSSPSPLPNVGSRCRRPGRGGLRAVQPGSGGGGGSAFHPLSCESDKPQTDYHTDGPTARTESPRPGRPDACPRGVRLPPRSGGRPRWQPDSGLTGQGVTSAGRGGGRSHKNVAAWQPDPRRPSDPMHSTPGTTEVRGRPARRVQSPIPPPEEPPMAAKFQLVSEYEPAGDQPKAIEQLIAGFADGKKLQVLLGATGTGQDVHRVATSSPHLSKPTLVLAHNKTLAAQLYKEFKGFFPHNAVHYFVSYYDYYQPEAYIPQRDIYIEKDSSINENIDRLRLAATCALVSREDVIIVASRVVHLRPRLAVRLQADDGLHPEGRGHRPRQPAAAAHRHPVPAERHRLRARQVPRPRRHHRRVAGVARRSRTASSCSATRSMRCRSSTRVTGETIKALDELYIYPAKHFVTPEERVQEAIKGIEQELTDAARAVQDRGQDARSRAAQGPLPVRPRHAPRGRATARASRTTPGGSAAASRASRRTRSSTSSPRTSCSSWTSRTSRCRRSAACTSATAAARRRSSSTGSGCPVALDNRPLKFDEFEKRLKTCLCLSATPGAVRTGEGRRRGGRAGDPADGAGRSGHPHQGRPAGR